MISFCSNLHLSLHRWGLKFCFTTHLNMKLDSFGETTFLIHWHISESWAIPPQSLGWTNGWCWWRCPLSSSAVSGPSYPSSPLTYSRWEGNLQSIFVNCVTKLILELKNRRLVIIIHCLHQWTDFVSPPIVFNFEEIQQTFCFEHDCGHDHQVLVPFRWLRRMSRLDSMNSYGHRKIVLGDFSFICCKDMHLFWATVAN